MEQNTEQRAYYDKEGDLIDLSVIYGVYKTREDYSDSFSAAQSMTRHRSTRPSSISWKTCSRSRMIRQTHGV